MGIMQTIFGNRPNPTVPNNGQPNNPNLQAQNTNPQGQQVAPTNVANATNPNVPSGVSAPAHSTEQQSQGANPLDGFKKLWENAPLPEGAAAPTSIVPMLDPKALRASIADASFTSSISPELMQKAMSGDAAAFHQVLNESNRATFEQALLASRSLMDTSINAFGDSQSKSLPNMVKNHMVQDTLQQNPLYQHEATRPLMEALRTQLTKQYPMASASEITSHAQNYIKEFVQVASPQQAAAAPTVRRSEDFSGF